MPPGPGTGGITPASGPGGITPAGGAGGITPAGGHDNTTSLWRAHGGAAGGSAAGAGRVPAAGPLDGVRPGAANVGRTLVAGCAD
mmetsp:Transcript_34314/g.81022  ORF Transcript_34314/g.81022 Transcript_34314/m.81022 type:complete len:85 (-) Transcript_34314:2146-2400(-)